MLEQLFDPHTALGFVAWLTITLQLKASSRRSRRLERTVGILAAGHAGDPAAHRELGKNLGELRALEAAE